MGTLARILEQLLGGEVVSRLLAAAPAPAAVRPDPRRPGRENRPAGEAMGAPVKTFEEQIDALAQHVASHPPTPQAGWPAAVHAMGDAVKAASTDGTFRVDLDRPAQDQVYVLRIEHRTRGRLRVAIRERELQHQPYFQIVQLLAAAKTLVLSFLGAQADYRRAVSDVIRHDPDLARAGGG
jgi:hypothetical protein